jgi:hypothetical protein
VRRVGALVAEVAVDLEHAVDAADDGALQIELGRDAHVQLRVEGVRVRDERACRGAARLHLQHRGLDLEEGVVFEGLAQALHDGRAGAGRLPGLIAHDEVEVALAHPGLFVQLGVQIGQRQDRLRRDLPLRHHDRQLAAAARDDFARDEDVVSEVDEFLPRGERLVAHVRERHHRLDTGSIARLQRGEAELAGVAAEDDSARDAGRDAGLGTGLELAVLGAQRRDRRRHRKRHRVGTARGRFALLDELRALRQTHGLLLEDVLFGGGGGFGRISHARYSSSVGAEATRTILLPAR